MNTRTDFVNPFKEARLRLHLTIDQLVNRTGFSKTFIINLEQGRYPEPPESVLTAFENQFERNATSISFSRVAVLERYKHFQNVTRKHNFGLLIPTFPVGTYLRQLRTIEQQGQLIQSPSERLSIVHPFEFWRAASYNFPNLNTVSKAFCIQQGLLHKFETQPHLVNSVPEPVVSALLIAGYDPSVLEALELAFTEYKQYLRNRALDKTNGTHRSAGATS